MRRVYLLSELLQGGYSMPARLTGERIQQMHMNACIKFSITQPIGIYIPNMWWVKI